MALPHAVTAHPDFTSLSPRAVKALIDIGRQYNSRNNGDLSLVWKVAHDRGWTSKDQLNKAIKELIEKELIIKTRQGGRHCCNLFAISWQPIDECKGKHDYSPTIIPPRKWSVENCVARITVQTGPRNGPNSTGNSIESTFCGPSHGPVNGKKRDRCPATRAPL